MWGDLQMVAAFCGIEKNGQPLLHMKTTLQTEHITA